MLKPFSFYLILVITSAFIGSMQTAYASEIDVKQEIQSYVDIFSSNNFSKQREAMDPLSWSGISDPALFDIIESKLLEIYLEDTKISKEQASWYAKTLGLSGNKKYIESLNTVAENASRKIRKHAATGIERLDKYEAWNPIISEGLIQAPSGQLGQFRIMNMLNSSDMELATIGAKRVYYAHSDNNELVSLAAYILKKEYQNTNDDDEKINFIAWLIKAISQSADSSYKPLLIEVFDTANEKKVVKYAKKYKEFL